MSRLEQKAVREFLKEVRQEGWEAHETNRGHIKLVHESGAICFCAPHSKDPRALLNTRADMRKALAFGSIRRKV